jgi:hypothetical protein
MTATATACVGAALCVYAVRQVDPDFWGYLLAGHLFADQGLTASDPFAYTSTGSQWITFEYGAELVLWSAYRYGGSLGLLALKGLLGGACLACVYATFRTLEVRVSVWLPLFLLTASGVSRYFLFRPQLFTFALFAAFVLVLFRHLLDKRAPLWVLPVAMVVWVNTHGGFVAGLSAIGLAIGLQAAAAVGAFGWKPRSILRRTRALWIAFAFSAVVTWVNPLGVRVWVYVVSELLHDTNRRYINEWAPASFSNDPWSFCVLILLALALAVASLILVTRSSTAPLLRAGPSHRLWAISCLPLLSMAFLSVRHTPLAAMWIGPITAMLGSGAAGALALRPLPRRVWFLVRGLAVVPVVLTGFVVLGDPGAGIRTDGFVLGRTHPCRAVAYMRAAGVQGHVYNPLWWGSYISWNLYPAVRVAMDGRNISLFPDALVEENLRFYIAAAAEVDPGVPLRYDTDLVLVPTDSPVISRVRRDHRWRVLYEDSDAALFSRTDRPFVAADARFESALPASCPTMFE